jgi:hypothetical protein
MTVLPQVAPLSNVQIEMLKLYSNGISEEELSDIRKIIAKYFMDRAINDASQIWEEKGYTTEKLLNEPS